jgi:hypothetical protein
VKRSFLFATLLSLGLLSSASAHASGFAGPKGARVDLRSLEVARSRAGGRTTTWWRARYSAPGGVVAFLVPVRAPAAVDVAPEAWLDALDEATAPRVVPPTASPPCPVSASPDVVLAPDAALRRRATGAQVVTTALDLDVALTNAGVEASPSTLAAARAELGRGRAIAVVVVAGGGDDASTPTVRVVSDGDEGALPLSLASSGPSSVLVTAYAIATSATRFGEGPALTIAPAAVSWPRGEVTYTLARATLLAQVPGAFLVESAGHGLLFDGTNVGGGVSAPPAAGRYFTLAESYGEAAGASACVNNAGLWSGRFVTAGVTCPKGALGRAGSWACEPTTGDLDPRAITCGAADDLAIALAGARPGEMGLSRAVATLPPQPTTEVALAPTSGSKSPVVEAGRYELVCGPSGGSSGGFVPPSGASSGDPEGEVLVATNDGCGGSGGTVYVPADDGTSDDTSDDSCSSTGTTASEDSDSDGCDASTESSTDDSSSDDSSSDDSSDDDSSSSSDDSSSDDSSSDDSCSKSSSSSSSSSSSGSSDAVKVKTKKGKLAPAKAAKPKHAKKHPRSPLSRAVLLLALVALPLRRAARGRTKDYT